MRKLAWMLPVVFIPFLWSCGGAGKGKPEKVLAVVNGETITEASFEEEAKSLPPYVRPILETPAGRMQFLESLITRDLLMQEALRRGIDRRDDVRERLNQVRRSIVLEALLRDHFREYFGERPGLAARLLMRRRLAAVYRSAVGQLLESGEDPEKLRNYVHRMLLEFPLDPKNLVRALQWAFR